MKDANKICLNCSKSYYIKPSHALRSKYCSKKCHNESMVHLVKKVGVGICVGCNGKFTDRPHKIKTRKYCSNGCKAAHFKPNFGKFNKEHNIFKNGIGVYRREALKFYGEKCQKCHTQERLEVHHIDYNRKNNEMNNLSVLCVTCHKIEHRTHTNKKICPTCKQEFFKKSRPKIVFCCRDCYYKSLRE